MRISKYSLTLAFVALTSVMMFAQTESNMVVYQGTSSTVTLTANAGASFNIKTQPLAGNTLALTTLQGDVYTYTYTPDPSFLGNDHFVIHEYKPTFPFVFADHLVTVSVVTSMVNTQDDFVKLNGDEILIIDPTANDETSVGDLDIEIAQVLKGSAEVDEDNNIVYTPTEATRDYIVYTATDSYGTSSKSTIYLTSDDLPSEDTDDSFQISSGTYEYIILPNSDYSLVDSDVNYGALEEISDYVYKYAALENVEGEDVLVFSNTDDLEHSVTVGVFLDQTDEGFIKDDIFYTASNTQLQFDVKENDLNGQYVISDYSEELIHMGDGVFSFTPDPGFSGELTLSYSGDSGVEEEDGTITIIVNNFAPTIASSYELTTPKNQPRIVEYDVPIGTDFFEMITSPTHGDLEIFAADQSVDAACEEGLQKVFALYTPDSGYTGSDQFMLRYCASDNNTCDNVTIVIEVAETDVDACICVDDCVWPGDANGDGKVTITDVLSVGRYIGYSGAAREDSPFGDIYPGTDSPVWVDNQNNGKNVSYADANGDGIVTESDLDVIVDNYGSLNSIVASDILGVKNIPFGFINDTDVGVGDLKVLPIYAGSEDFPAIDIQGITFKTSLPPQNVDESTIDVEFYEDNYFVKNSPFVSVVHQTSPGQVYAGGIKTNSLSSTGYGIIGQLSFIVEEDAEGIRPLGRSSNAANTFTIELTEIVVEDTDGNKYTLPNSSITLKLRDKSEGDDTFVAYPNPANDHVVIKSTQGEKMSLIEMYSVTGQKIRSNQVSQEKETIDISSVQRGVYFLKVYGEKTIQTIKLIKG